MPAPAALVGRLTRPQKEIANTYFSISNFSMLLEDSDRMNIFLEILSPMPAPVALVGRLTRPQKEIANTHFSISNLSMFLEDSGI